MSEILDLVVLVADTDAEWTVRTLLEHRYHALGIRTIAFKVFRHPQRDAGVFLHAHEFLRDYVGQASHAMVLLDLEGSGRETLLPSEMEAQIEDKLSRNGWAPEQIAAIVLEPELEIWVWAPSPHVAEVVGLEAAALQHILEQTPRRAHGKPQRPKETLLRALHQSKRPFSARLFQELAQRVSLRCSERSFVKFRDTLQRWFPPEGSAAP